MVHELILQAIGRIGGVVLLFGLLWLGLTMPSSYELKKRSMRSGPLLVIVLGFIMLAIGLGAIDLHFS